MYKNVNDYELLYLISENEEVNFNVLYQKYYPMIYKMAKEYVNSFKKYGYDLDDLIQIGLIALYKASKLYSATINSLFYTYFKATLKNAFMTELRRNSTLRREVLNNAFSYDSVINDSNISFIETIPDKGQEYDYEYNNYIINFKNSMPFDLANIFEMYYNGYGINEISRLFDKKKSFIQSGLNEIKKFALTYGCLFF